MFRLLLVTPAAIFDRRHVAMNRVQGLLAGRLRPRLPGVEVASALVCDYIAPEYADDLREVGAAFDYFVPTIPEGYGTAWGIRKPTNFAVSGLAAGYTHLLRIIQDTFITDPDRFAAAVRGVIGCPGEWIGANVHHWPTTGHQALCSAMGLQCEPDLRYPNGAVLLAPVSVWQTYYLGLPTAIHHYWDDVMMGEWLRQSGGSLLDLPVCWEHLHDCPEETACEVYGRQMADLATPGLSVSRSPATRMLPCPPCP
jgi:hypothetical protein